MNKIKAMQVGLGPIGQTTVKCILQRNNLQLVGAVDPHPDKAGQDLAQLCALDFDPGITVSPDITNALTAITHAIPGLRTMTDMPTPKV